MNSEEGGLAIWLINLPRSEARRVRMDQQLDAMGLDYKRFLAVDGREEWNNLLPTLDLDAFRKALGRDPMPGEVGAYISHLAVWEELLDSYYDVALVLEDDVVFHDDFLGALHMAMLYPESWDLLKLAQTQAVSPITQRKIGPYALNAYLGQHRGMGAYLIHRKVAERLIKQILPIRLPLDQELDQIQKHDLRHFGLEPSPCHIDTDPQNAIAGAAFGHLRKTPWYRRLSSVVPQMRLRFERKKYLHEKGRLYPRAQK